MVQINLKSLVSRLDDVCRRTLEAAAGLCLSRTNYNVEIEHWLAKLLEANDTDLGILFRHFGVDPSRVATDLTKALDRLKTGNARPPALSPDLVSLAREAWVLGSIEYGTQQTRSAHILAALLSDESLSRLAADMSNEFQKINPATLVKDLPDLVLKSPEVVTDVAPVSAGGPAGGAAGGARPNIKPGTASKTPALDQYTIDMTARARAGEIDPVLGRDNEIRQIIDILTRRRQNNPIITGEAGVGKTAAVEGFALRIAAGDVPEALKDISLRSLDLALLQAGAGVKGEFENRLKSVIQEVKSSPTPIVLFIDEAHTMIGAGGQAGQGDAANLLKPALARGELRTIAATTWAEYKKYFEKDAALARRFQVVKVDEPSEPVCVEMIRGLADTLELHHKVRILDEGVIEAVRLSNRYITGRQLPDKAVSLIDTACARVALGQQTTPAVIEDLRREIEQTNVEKGVLERETLSGIDHSESLQAIAEKLAKADEKLTALNDRWQKEKELVQKVRGLREQLEQASAAATNGAPANGAPAVTNGDAAAAAAKAAATPAPDRAALKTELDAATTELRTLQGDSPLMQICVDGQAIADIVSSWTGIPVGKMVSDEIQTILHLKDRLEERIVGQSHGLEAIARSIQTSRARLRDPRRPVGVFMLAGPSGVGKTETALALAELLYGGENHVTTINMSEYKEEHKVSLLMGSPPGYVGYGEGGVLTEAVRRRPYSVVLLDELEKAHPGVQEIFYQVFDKGQLRDGEGRDIDFKNTVIIMTSNAGTDLVMKLCADPDTTPDPDSLATALHEELLKTFKPAFLGRTTLIPYFPLRDEVLKKIIALKLKSVSKRVTENYKASFSYTPAVVDHILARCREVESGARNVDNILSGTLLPEMSNEFLSRMAEGVVISKVEVDVSSEPDGGFVYHIS